MSDKHNVNYALHLRNEMSFPKLFDLLEIGEINDETNGATENHKDINEVADMINKLETIVLNIGKEHKYKKIRLHIYKMSKLQSAWSL